LRIQKHIPNIFTLSNLTCGVLAILYALEGELTNAGYFILFGAFFDFFDGMLARIFKVSGELGKQLDSLADMVSFGVAPAMIVFQLLNLEEVGQYYFQYIFENGSITNSSYLPYIAFLIPVFSALRLAKFNIDDRQHDSFIGVPTPAVALFFISFPLIIEFQNNHFLTEIIASKVFIIASIIVLSLLMVSDIYLLSFKFKNLKWKENKSRFIFIIISLILLLQFHFLAIPIIILLYPLVSLIKKTK
jgi:CDP-diacylglycerol--serine O-phosphatidyltransferase